MFKLIVLTCLVTACFAFDCDNYQLQKVGCYKRNGNVFKDMLANNRDSSSDYFTGKVLDWQQFESSLESLACACAAKAKSEGYIAIALGYYGECFATKDRDSFEQLKQSPSSLSNACVNHGFTKCKNSDNKCVGQANAEYIYDFPSQAPAEINGGYSEWSEYTECSASCGEGAKYRERACNSPTPQNGGDGCEALGESTQSKACKIKDCPVNGKYGAWTSYGSCSKTCGGGSQKRTRKCDSPAPRFGGDECVGTAEQSQTCNTQNCPVNGQYGTWSSYGSCSKSCNSGVKTKKRTCNNPAPAYGGSQCSGSDSHSINCNTQPCLKSTGCVYRYTDFKNDGDGKPVYLDRHSLHCPSGYVINFINLQRNGGHDKIRYKYRCCRSRLSCSDSLKTNGKSYNGGGEGNSVYLDRQSIQCSNKGISYLKLDRSGDKWNYKYHCCSVSYSRSSVSCYYKNTSFSNDGDGDAVYLDRHTIQCNSDKDFITYLKLSRNSGHDKVRYDYKCCSINVPSVTN